MDAGQSSDVMSIAQLGHHPGLHVMVNLEGRSVGGLLFDSEHWVRGKVVALSGVGDYVTVELDEPIGGTEPRGLLHRAGRGQDLVSIDDPGRVRPLKLEDVQSGGVPEEIVELVRAGKTLQAIKRYRALNGATLDEARAAIARL